MNEVFIPLGVIGSGKTKAGHEWAMKHPPCTYLEGDAIRTMLFGGYGFDKHLEDSIIEAMFILAGEATRYGYNVVLDDATLGYLDRYRAKTMAWEIVKGYLPPATPCIPHVVPLPTADECIRRRMLNPRGYSEEDWRRVYREQMREFELSGLYHGRAVERKNDEGVCNQR